MGSEQQDAFKIALEDTLSPLSHAERTKTSLDDPAREASIAEQVTLDGHSPDDAAYLRTVAAPDLSSIPKRFAGSHSPSALGQWSRYEIISQIGQGGMGTVYKARDRQLGRLVAIKFIRDPDESMVARFIQEARAQSRIEHPNICKIYEVGEVAGRTYIAMQYIAGDSLDRQQKSLSTDEKVAILATVCEAIEAAHQVGILHRDIKPSNIMVHCDEHGTRVPVVMDFGLARETQESRGLTESGAVLGTPAYMSPEQARGDVRSLDARSDVYSLGATLFDLLTGAPPFADDTVVNILLHVVTKEAPSLRSRNPTLPAALGTICARCLAKDKEQRYGSAKALAEDLRRTLNAERIVAKRVSLWYRLKWRASQNRPAAALVLALFVSLFLFAGYGVYSRIKAQQEAELLRELAQDGNEVEWLLRSAYQLPLHDTAGEQSVVQRRIASLKQRLEHSTGRLSGLLLYAIGRGQLALHEFDEAERSLKGALAHGIDLPDLHFALGRALGERYHQQLTAARYSGDPTFFAARKRQLATELLRPALDSLSRSRSAKLAAPEYLEGLIAFYQEQYDAGLRSAEAAAQKAPWLYEAVQLQGDILLARGMDLVQHGDYAKAEATLQSAVTRYERAADIARSDAQVHEVLTETWIQLGRLPGKKAADAAIARTAALRAAESTITAAPARSSGYSKKAYALFWEALAKYQAGQDMKPVLAELRRSAQAAVDRNPHDAVALDVLGNSYDLAGSDKNDRGQDPSPEYTLAMQHLQEAVRADPKFPWAWNDMAANLQHIGNYRLVSGADPTDYLQNAVKASSQAILLDPQFVAPYTNALGAYADWVTYLVERGEDPTRLIDDAKGIAGRLFALNPRPASGRRIMGKLELAFARYLFDAGRDPESAIDRALSQLQEAEAIAPDHPDLALSLATVYQMRARLRVDHKQNPAADLDKSRVFVERCRARNPELAGCLVASARGELALADWSVTQRRPALPELLQAEDMAGRAVKLSEVDTEALYELSRARYQILVARGKSQSFDEIEKVLHVLDRALRSNPAHARSHALRGAVLLLRAEHSTDRESRQVSARDAQVSFAQSQKINPLMVRLHAPEAARLSVLLDALALVRAPKSSEKLHRKRSSL